MWCICLCSGHRPTKLQLLLLDVTIVFFQGLLATISYETSLSATMPEDIPDPLLPEPEPSEVIFESYDPTLPLTYPPYPSPFPYPNNSNATINASSSYTRLPSESLDTLSKPNRQQTLPPPAPVIDVRFRHIIRRLTSPIPVPPTPTNSESESDNALSAMQLPLPATTSIQLATIFNVLSRAAAARRRETEERSPRGSQPTSNRRNAESISNGQVRSGRSSRRDNERRGGRRHNTTTIGSIYSPGTSRREEPMPRNVEREGTMPGSIGDNES